MKRILLTGSTSFLGSKFIQLYESQFDILGIAKSDENNPMDILDFDGLKKLYAKFNPDIIIHTAAVTSSDADRLETINVKGTQNIIDIAKIHNTPLIFISSESIYGGKEQTGNYLETDPYKPRSRYAKTKVESEIMIKKSGLNYLIVRLHRFVGINKTYDRPKQFPDTLKALLQNQQVHLDSHRLFKPCLINHISKVFVHYIKYDCDKQVIINVGVDKATTYYDLIKDVAVTLDLNQELIKSDGEESEWPENSTLSIEKMRNLGYPLLSYLQLLEILKQDWDRTS